MKKEIVRYEISGDGVGLLAYFEDGNYYYCEYDEFTKLEQWIHKMLLEAVEALKLKGE
jgi:hypothetical protein